MRRTLLVGLAALCLPLSSSAQEQRSFAHCEETRTADRHRIFTCRSGQPNDPSVRVYDVNWRYRKLVRETYDRDSDGTPEEDYRVVLDSSGEMVDYFRMTSASQDHWRFIRDPLGNLLEELHDRNSDGILDRWYVLSRNKGGALERAAWYYFDPSGALTSAVTILYHHGVPQNLTLDFNGDLHTEHHSSALDTLSPTLTPYGLGFTEDHGPHHRSDFSHAIYFIFGIGDISEVIYTPFISGRGFAAFSPQQFKGPSAWYLDQNLDAERLDLPPLY